ncbi:MAG: exonuclease domain-containing protein [Pseudorhodoplanes sp.]|nr:exonuclease domain-containing protein [Pseudorhodoplanes sp.]
MSLLSWFRGREARTPPRLNIVEGGPAEDAVEEQQCIFRDDNSDGLPDEIEGVALGLEYANASGEVSARRVIAGRVSPGGGEFFYLEGWCLLRKDWRTFRSDRMLKLMLPPAWTSVADPTTFLRTYLPKLPTEARAAAKVNPKLLCRDGLAVLLYLARSDGDVLPAAERDVVTKYIGAVFQRAGLTPSDEVSADVAAYADTLYPSEQSMESCLSRLERDPGALDLLVPHLTALVKADGTYSEQEQLAVAALVRAIEEARAKAASSQALAAQQLASADFLAVDVETANADMASICAIGLVHFKSGEISRKLTILIDPEDHFDPVNISIHGIRPEDVAGKPTMREALPVVAAALQTAVVVHHTHFDRVALCRAAQKYGLPDPSCRWLDSARVARRAWERFAKRGYGLKNLADTFGIDFEHHDACEDARAAGMIVLRAITDTGCPLDEWLDRVTAPISGIGGRQIRSGRPDGPLSGEVVVFTGKLSITRAEAADMAAAAGMEVAGSVTEETSILVVGDQDLRRLAGEEQSAKHRRAEQLIREGAALRIIGETDFKLMLGTDGATADADEDEVDDDTRNISLNGLTPEASRISLLVDQVNAAKRERRLDDAVRLLLEEIESQETESRSSGFGVAPWYYEQLAIVYRKLDRQEDELAVLERYDRQIKAPGSKPAILKARLEKVRARRSTQQRANTK